MELNLAMILYVIANIILFTIFILGALLIWGAIRHWPLLFKLPDSDWLNLFRFFQRNFGDKSLVLYYIALGIMFITGSIVGLISINKGGIP